MECAVLFSGGKDSTYAAWLAKKKGYALICLITLVSKNKDSYMFHTPSISKTEKQAKVMNLPLIVKTTKGIKEEELKDLEDAIKTAIKKYKINCLVTGALHSVYQASRIQKICDKLKIKCFNPLWHKNEETYWKELFENDFEIIITGVACWGLDKSWLGRKIDKEAINELKELRKKFHFHLAFEGGEAETFVTDCPLFKKKIKIIRAEKIWDGTSGKYIIEKTELVDK